ncbi:hypothetical protein [Opitutus sp. ER46]|uniref:hypothetical protein n=1 Tax=Opitutus sp. ER46 TaxID=2161864 RepID=UPI00130506B8|nr:hypothetical protein [Opitutus sp. ER46]
MIFGLVSKQAFGAGIDLRAPIPELQLSDGTVLHNVLFVSYATSAAMAKWDGGRGTIQYANLPPDVLAAMRSRIPQAAPPPPPPPSYSLPAASGHTKTITGQIFTTISGTTERISEAHVEAYPLAAMDDVKAAQKRYYAQHPNGDRNGLGTTLAGERDAFAAALKNVPIVASGRTDADGVFTISVPDNIPVFLFCRGIMHFQGYPMLQMWFVPATEGKMILSGDNAWMQWRDGK